MPIQLFCFGFGIKFEYLVLIGFEINFFKSDMPVAVKWLTDCRPGGTGWATGACPSGF